MKQKKLLFVILSFIFIGTFLSHSNENRINYKDNKAFFSFNNLQQNGLNEFNFYTNPEIISSIQHYKMSRTQVAKLGLVMGIAGSAMAGTGILLIIPGSILMGISCVYYGAPYSIQRHPPANPGYGMWFSGIGLLAGGITLFLLGVPLAVVGFILYFRGGRLAALIESSKDEARLGFRIKL